MGEFIGDESNIEIHYYLRDSSHSLDAFIHNRAQFEFLAIAREIASAMDFDLQIEVYPLAEGGIKQYFKLLTKGVRQISIGVITALITNFIITPLTQWSNKIFEDQELSELNREKLRLEIKNLNLDAKLKEAKLGENQKLAIHKSRLYRELQKSSKIEKISVQAADANREILIPEKVVLQEHFPEYILDSNVLPPIHEEHAEIEIISPVLKNGNYKWRGIYSGMPISFSMRSHEFKSKVLAGEINFKNGFSIDCHLIQKRELDENGNEKIKGYIVNRVNRYFVNDIPIETEEGRKKRIADENDANQLWLFADPEVGK